MRNDGSPCGDWTAYRCKRWPGHEGPCALEPNWWMRLRLWWQKPMGL
jgi:hypothetical protein